MIDPEKRARLLRFCTERGVEGVYLRRRANIAWLTDGADVHCDLATELGIATLLWTPERALVLTDTIEDARLRAEEFGDGFEFEVADWWTSPRPPSGRFASDWPDDELQPLRESLTDREVERVRVLGRESAKSLQDSLTSVRPGQREHEVAALVVGSLRALGIHAHVCLVAADGRIARYRHPIPTEARVERVLMAAICAQRRGLIVTATRSVHFGAVDADLRRRHAAVCAVDAALHAATRPGARWCDLLRRAIEVYADTGFPDEWRKHHQGGPMGYAARDFKATPHETRRVAERQLVGWNPSITGTKSEDTLLSSGEVVTHVPGWPMLGTRPDLLVI